MKLGLCLLFALAGCASRAPSAGGDTPHPTPVTVRSAEASESAVEPAEQTVEVQSAGELVAVLGSTKGNQPTVGDRILRAAEVREFLGDDWTRWRGRRVRARGRLVDHRCDPRAQCLLGGVIPLLVELSSLELCRSAAGDKEPGAVSCPAGPDCFDACREQQDECAATTPKTELLRCGCAHAHCSEGCRKHGFADFECP
ncbi:MAG: hypothetical protein KF718_00375 [Polyangiaceae bacterium]|nr:hypothetical protein [Polyangiaceae bacterium]